MINDEVKNDIQNIDLEIFNKKKFTINGDPNRVLELDVSDLNIITRIKEQYPILEKLGNKVASISLDEGASDLEIVNEASDKLKEVDDEMRMSIDKIFDSNVSEICAPSGSMYDPINGKFRYEHIIDTLIKLYDENLTEEVKKIQKRVSKHTAKYTK